MHEQADVSVRLIPHKKIEGSRLATPSLSSTGRDLLLDGFRCPARKLTTGDRTHGYQSASE